METYEKKIKNNKSVELIMISGDEEPDRALAWAKDLNFQWPTVLFSDYEKAIEQGKVFMSKAEDKLPFYMLVDKEGKVVAKGEKKEVFEAAGL